MFMEKVLPEIDQPCHWWNRAQHVTLKMSKYGVFSGPYFPILSPNTGTRINSIFEHFSRSPFHSVLVTLIYPKVPKS